MEYNCNYCGYAWLTAHKHDYCPICGSDDIEKHNISDSTEE